MSRGHVRLIARSSTRPAEIGTIIATDELIATLFLADDRLMAMQQEDEMAKVPYGATTLAGSDGSRQPSPNELDIARYQGKHVAELAARLFH